jgi:hypothetical protein
VVFIFAVMTLVTSLMRRNALVATQVFGAGNEPDEGTPAHLFHLLMVSQAPIILFFAVKWLPRDARQASRILALQVIAALAAFAPVYFTHL